MPSVVGFFCVYMSFPVFLKPQSVVGMFVGMSPEACRSEGTGAENGTDNREHGSAKHYRIRGDASICSGVVK
jgi:hypothetical protein